MKKNLANSALSLTLFQSLLCIGLLIVSGESRAANARLSDPGGRVLADFSVSPDSVNVVFVADSDRNGFFELFSVPVDGSGVPRKLSFTGFRSPRFAQLFGPDGTRVVFREQVDLRFGFRVFSVPVDGSTPSTQLNDSTTDTGVAEFLVSPSDGTVVYKQITFSTLTEELFTVPLDGSLAPVKLPISLAAGRKITSFQITPDGTHVVYIANQDDGFFQELYSVPIDGSSAPIKLNDGNALRLTGGDVLDFSVTSDGGTVVYMANQDSFFAFELFRVPTDGSAAPLKIEGAVVPPSSLSFPRFAFVISPDDTRIVYFDDQDDNGLFEIFSVPLDGSAAPVRLNGPLPQEFGFITVGGISNFEITADSTQVVYSGDQETDDVFELFRVPIDGSADPVKLNIPLVADGDVFTFVVNPNGNSVVYRADQDTDGMIELFSVQLDGSTPPRKLNDPLVTGGNVNNPIHITPDGTRVVFRAKQEFPNELFSEILETNNPPIANAGFDQFLECTGSSGGQVILDGSGSFDPDGDALSFSWTGPFPEGGGAVTGASPTVTLPFGSSTITLIVDDGQLSSEPDTFSVNILDTTAPGIAASLGRVGEGDDEGDSDEGRFRIAFSAVDACDLDPEVTAVLISEASNCQRVSVIDGQVFEFEFDDEGCEIESEDGFLEIEAPNLTLQVTAIDNSGNSSTAEVQPSGLSADNDTEDEVDD